MRLEPLDEIFPDEDLTAQVAVIPSPLFGLFGVPWGDYHLRELYCTDPNCDCRLVQVHFIHESCVGRAAEWRQYGWLMAGGKRQAPVAASISYCWGVRRRLAYVRLGRQRGHWVKLPRLAPDFLGLQIPRYWIFRGLLGYLMKEDPTFKEHFREHYRMVKRRAWDSPLPQAGDGC